MENPYYKRLYDRAHEIAHETQLQILCKELKASGLTSMEIDVEVFFALIHEGYRQRYMEEKMLEDANWDFGI